MFSIHSDSDDLLTGLWFWNGRTIFLVFAGMPWPVSTTMCAPSATGEFFVSLFSWIKSQTYLQTETCVFQGRRKLLQGEPIQRLLFASYHQVRTWPGSNVHVLLSHSHWWNICMCFHSTSGRMVPENSLFSATINAGSFLCEFPCNRSSLSEISHCTGLDLDLSSSSAVLHLPPCSRPGEARLPLHAEQVWPGVRRSGGSGRLCGWKLQREYCTSCSLALDGDALQAVTGIFSVSAWWKNEKGMLACSCQEGWCWAPEVFSKKLSPKIY